MKGLRRSWKGLKSIGQAITITTTSDGKETSEIRHYISSRDPKVKEFSNSVRGHWGIESMHWVLDVVFGEDSSRLRNGDSTQNFGFLRKYVISLLKRDTSKGSMRGKRKKAAWSTDFLGNSHEYLKDQGFGGRNIDARAQYFYMATFNSPAMVWKLIGRGSQYAWGYLDSEGDYLDGGPETRQPKLECDLEWFDPAWAYRLSFDLSAEDL